MEYRNVGKSGLLVSMVGLGGNNIGGKINQDETKVLVNKAIDLGVTLFDTADVYGGTWGGQRGWGEEFLGAALKPHRRNVVIATKSFNPMGEGPYWMGLSRRYLMDALDACLRRLDTDYVDIYEMHRPDPRTPMEETMRFLDDCVRSGKVRYLGHDAFVGWQIGEAEWVSRAHNLERCVVTLREYNMLVRDIRQDVIPVCERYGIGLIPTFPLASGFLTGKYRPGQAAPEGARLAEPSSWTDRTLTEKNYATLTRLEEFCNRSGHTMLELALGWLASQPVVSSIIAGATRPDQLEQNVKAGETRLTADEMAEIEKILTD